jgi:hypothetical protein
MVMLNRGFLGRRLTYFKEDPSRLMNDESQSVKQSVVAEIAFFRVPTRGQSTATPVSNLRACFEPR